MAREPSSAEPSGGADADMARRRAELVRLVEQEVRQTAGYTGRTQLRPGVIAALGRVPRERFVPPAQAPRAYANVPLAIGSRQTISQPYMVALMTDLLEPAAEHRVLEIGTGSGYQAAVLSQLVARVFTVEHLPELAEAARVRLAELDCSNVACRLGDGNEGWPEHAPYDGIIVTAGARKVPPALLEQLAPGAHLVIPVTQGHHQVLRRITRRAQDRYDSWDLMPVAFVPLI